MFQEGALNGGFIDSRAVKTAQIRKKMSLARFGDLGVLARNRVIKEHDIVLFAAADGRFLSQQRIAADAAVCGGDIKGRHGGFAPFLFGKGNQDDGRVISPACQAGLQDQTQPYLVHGPGRNGQDDRQNVFIRECGVESVGTQQIQVPR